MIDLDGHYGQPINRKSMIFDRMKRKVGCCLARCFGEQITEGLLEVRKYPGTRIDSYRLLLLEHKASYLAETAGMVPVLMGNQKRI